MQTNRFFSSAILLVLALTMSSCDIIGGIFEAGAWTGIIGLFLGIALVIWLISKLFGRGK